MNYALQGRPENLGGHPASLRSILTRQLPDVNNPDEAEPSAMMDNAIGRGIALRELQGPLHNPRGHDNARQKDFPSPAGYLDRCWYAAVGEHPQVPLPLQASIMSSEAAEFDALLRDPRFYFMLRWITQCHDHVEQPMGALLMEVVEAFAAWLPIWVNMERRITAQFEVGVLPPDATEVLYDTPVNSFGTHKATAQLFQVAPGDISSAVGTSTFTARVGPWGMEVRMNGGVCLDQEVVYYPLGLRVGTGVAVDSHTAHTIMTTSCYQHLLATEQLQLPGYQVYVGGRVRPTITDNVVRGLLLLLERGGTHIIVEMSEVRVVEDEYAPVGIGLVIGLNDLSRHLPQLSAEEPWELVESEHQLYRARSGNGVLTLHCHTNYHTYLDIPLTQHSNTVSPVQDSSMVEDGTWDGYYMGPLEYEALRSIRTTLLNHGANLMIWGVDMAYVYLVGQLYPILQQQRQDQAAEEWSVNDHIIG